MGSGGSFFRRRGLSSALALVTALTTFLVATPAEIARAATLTVCSSGCDYTTIQAAVTGAASAGDVIQVAPGTYVESVYVSSQTVTIEATGGASQTTIQAPADDTTIVTVNTGNLTLVGFTITGAQQLSFTNPGGVFVNNSSGTVTVRDSVITANTGGRGGGLGGFGTMAVINTVVTNNSADDGGGLWSSGSMTVIDSTITGNSATDGGGGIYNATFGNPTLQVVRTTISNNSASRGGGIATESGTAVVEQSLISGNTASQGAGVWITGEGVTDNDVQLRNSTVADNVGVGVQTSGTGTDPANAHLFFVTVAGNATGVQTGAAGTVTLARSLVASNTTDCTGTIEMAAFNLVGIQGAGCTLPGASPLSNDMIGTPTAPVDPLLAPLSDNGGATFTMALMAASPAIGAAGTPATACLAEDQRGIARPQPVGGQCDIGAFELELSASPLQDLIDAAPSSTAIVVPDGTYPELITIGGAKTLQAQNPGAVIIDGSNLNGTVVTGTGDFAIEGIQITGGNVTGDGGGIFVPAETSATLTNVVVTGNTASSEGGGVYVSGSSSLTVIDSQFSGNDAGSGGAIYDRGSVEITGSTFSLNTASSGGAIYQHLSASPLMINAPSACATHPIDPAFVPLTVFVDNSASSGGAIETNTFTYIYDTSFVSNDATNGGAMYLNDWDDPTFVTCSLFELNEAVETGGAVSSQDEGNIFVVDSAFDANTAGDWGGAIGGEFGGFIMDIEGSTFTNNSSLAGGAVYADDDTAIRQSTFTGNTASSVNGSGGAIYWDGASSVVLTLDQLTVDNNSANVAGGLYVGGSQLAHISNSTISNNAAVGTVGTVGGGILIDGDLLLTNSTVSGNSAASNGGGVGVIGGSEFSQGGSAVFSYVTLAGNSAVGNGGAFNATGFADVIISNSISAGNSNGTGGPNCFSLTSLGNNVIGGAAGCTLHDTDSTAPALIGPLADNGGPTLTHLPQAASPAIDGGFGAMQVAGGAVVDDGILLAAPGVPVGSAFLIDPVDVSQDFSVIFNFRITPTLTPPGGGADGITFSIFDNPTALGLGGGFLGIASGSTVPPTGPTIANGVASGVSVEFDTWVNGQAEGAYDPNGNHIGIDLNGNVNSVVTTTAIGNLSDGSEWTAWIDYDSATDLIEVRASNNGVRPSAPTLSYTVDIAATVGGPAYVGFTGASGSIGISGEQRVSNFALNGVAVCELTDQRGLPRPVGQGCDIGAVELQSTTIETGLTVEIDQLALPAESSVIPITDLNVGTFFGATEGPSSTQLGAIQLGAIQLGAIQLGAIGLADAAGHMTIGSIINAANEINAAASPTVIPTILDTVTLVDIPVVGGWDPILAGTSLAGRPSYTVTLQQVIDVLVDLDRLRDLRIAESGLTASQLGAIQLGAIQLGAIQLGAIQLGAIQLGAIGDQLTALCAGDLDCGALGINPSNSNSYDDFSVMALTLMGVDLDFAQLGAIQLGAIDPEGTQLGAIQLGAIQLGAIDLNALTIGNTQLGAIQLGAIQLGAIQLGAIGGPPGGTPALVTQLCASGLDCAELGIDPAGPFAGDELDGYSLLALGAMGANLESTQLGAIQLGAIQLGAIGDLESTQLGAIQLGAIQLGAIDPASTQLGAIQLGAIGPSSTQLGAIQLGAIDFNNPVFAQLGAIQLGAIQLGAIATSTQLGAIQLGAIQLGAIANPSAIISCGSLAGGCSGNGLMTLLELQRLGLILPTATLADLAEAIGDIPLSDLAAAGLDIVALVGTATLLDLLPETTIAELPPELTLGQLAELWVGMPVFELLLALLNPAELSWEDVDPAVLASQHPAVTGWSVDFTMAGEPGAVAGAEFPFTAEASVNLPSGMAYVPGSAQISVGGAPATLISDPEEDGNTLQWVIDGLELNSNRIITFDMGTAFTADTSTPVTTTVNTLGYTASDTAPTIVIDVEPPPNDSFATATDIGGDVVVLGRIGSANDVDMFKISNVPPGATIEAYLNPGGVDLDLVLYEPGQVLDDPLRGPAERIVDGSLDPTIGIDPVEQDQESLADIANPENAPVLKASLHRSTSNEAIVTPPLRGGGDFYLQISGYNGATPDSIYVSRIRVIDPPAANACAARPLADPGTWLSPTLPSGVGAETLYLMNTELFRDTFGDADTDSVLNAISLVQGVPGVPTGVVVPVEGDNDVADAYAAWLDAAGNCSVDRANDVASAIGALVDDYRAANPDIANIVIVGGDDQIPFFRVKDQGIVANEREYRSTFTGNNPLVASLADGTVLTDAPYSDPNPLYVPQGDREVFIPQLPTGRLVDQPEEIIGALAQFVASSGKLETVVSPTNPAPTAQVLGYDFLSDSSATIAGSLADQGFGVTSVVNETWDKSALKAAMDSSSAIVNVNAHFDHTAALPAAGNLTNTFNDLYQFDDLLPTTSTAYEGKIIFSMGCHAGLNAADSYLAVGDPAREWAQELLLRDAVFVGNTGFGYGDSDFEAYSEALMSLFAQKIETSNTIGEAFVAAQQTLAGKTAKWSPYHDKSQMEATLYGLPFYQLHATPVTPTAPATFLTSPVEGTELQSLTTNAIAALTQETTTDGDYLVGDDVLAVPFRPVQPLELINVTPTDPSLRATGAIIEGGTSTDLLNFDVLYARPILYNELAEPETETTGAFPNALQAITSFETPGGTVDQLLLARGRYFPSTRTQQRWDTMDLTVYYVPDSVIDVAPPTISRVSAVEVTAGQVNFEVEADDASGVVRVVVLYKTAGTSGAWTKLELTSTAGLWTGNVSGITAAQNVDFFVQVLGGDGQVAVSTDKAEMHQVQPPGPPRIQVVSGTVGNNGIYKTSVEIGLVGPANAPGADLQYAIGNGSFIDYTPGMPILFEDGTQTVRARPSLAPTSVVTRTVVVDSTEPTVTVANPTAPGVKLELNSTVPLQYFCADTGGSGIAKCKGTVGNGAPLPTDSVGLHVAQVTATDKAGNTHVALVPYEVVPEEPMTLTSDVSLVSVGTTVNFTATYSETGVSPHTVDWNFEAGVDLSGALTVDVTTATGVVSHQYAATGVFPVTATVTHGTGYVQTQVLQYIVVYDPAEGFVTGGGWFDSPSGAYTPGDSEDPDIVGKAKFGFVSKYKKGASVPTGKTKFELKAGDLDFRSTAYEWMVISGKKAQYKGVGTVEGWEGEFNFRLTVMDADVNPNDRFDKDTFRIEIWRSGNGPHFVLYDNGMGADPSTDEGTTELGGGSIKIHSGKTK